MRSFEGTDPNESVLSNAGLYENTLCLSLVYILLVIIRVNKNYIYKKNYILRAIIRVLQSKKYNIQKKIN